MSKYIKTQKGNIVNVSNTFSFDVESDRFDYGRYMVRAYGHGVTFGNEETFYTASVLFEGTRDKCKETMAEIEIFLFNDEKLLDLYDRYFEKEYEQNILPDKDDEDNEITF